MAPRMVRLHHRSFGIVNPREFGELVQASVLAQAIRPHVSALKQQIHQSRLGQFGQMGVFSGTQSCPNKSRVYTL